MFKPKCPCVQDCPDRKVGCKAICEKFIKWDIEYKEYRAGIEQKSKEKDLYCSYKHEVLKKPMKNIYRKKIAGRTK